MSNLKRSKATGQFEEDLSVDGANLVVDGALALKSTVVGALTYVAEAAPPGDAFATRILHEAGAVWRVSRIDTTTGTALTWADGNANFDNVATDLTILSYR